MSGGALTFSRRMLLQGLRSCARPNRAALTLALLVTSVLTSAQTTMHELQLITESILRHTRVEGWIVLESLRRLKK